MFNKVQFNSKLKPETNFLKKFEFNSIISLQTKYCKQYIKKYKYSKQNDHSKDVMLVTQLCGEVQIVMILNSANRI